MDARTETPRLGDDIDVETQALISLSEAVKGEITDRAAGDRDRRSYPPLYQEASDLLADDVLRLLVHQRAHPAHGPRRLPQDPLRLPPGAVPPEDHEAAARHGPAATRTRVPTAASSSTSPACRTPAPARLAERSAAAWFGRIPGFVRATFTVKKLDDLAQHLARRGQLRRPPGGFFQVGDLLACSALSTRRSGLGMRPVG